MRTCLPSIHLSLLQINPCAPGMHDLVSTIIGGKFGSEKQSKDYIADEDRTTSNMIAHGDIEEDGENEENVSVHLVQAALHQSTTNDDMIDNNTTSMNHHNIGHKDNSPGEDASLRTRSNVTTIGHHKDQVFALAVAGDLLYSASASTDIRVFRAPLFEELDCFGSGSGIVNSLMAFGDRLYSAHQDNKIRLWKRVRIADSKCKHKLLAVLPRLDHFVKRMLLQRNYVQVRRHKTKLWTEHADTISALALGGGSRSRNARDVNRQCTSPSVLYSASWDKTVKVWNLNNHKCTESFYAHNDAINAMTVIDGLVLVTASADCSIKLWTRMGHSPRTQKHSLLASLHGHKAAVNALAMSANEKILYSGDSDGVVIAWKKVCNRAKTRVSTPKGTWSGRVSSSGGACLAAHERESAWSGEMDMILREAYSSESNSADGMLGTGEESLTRKHRNGHIAGIRRVYKTASRSISFVKRKVIVGHTRAVLSVSTVGNDIVCSSSADKTIKVWIRRAELAGSSRQGQPCGRCSDSGSREPRGGTGGDLGGRSARWEYECLAVLEGHSGPVKAIASVMSPAGTAALADQPLIARPKNSVYSVSCAAARRDADDALPAYRHDGVVVYSAGFDSKVKVWTLPSSLIPRLFTHNEK